MKFPYLLFDADNTLFDFPKAAARAFSAMCRSNGIPDTLDTRALYHRINQELWAAFDRGEVSKDYVTLERFVRFFQALKLPRDPDKCNRDYLTALGAGVYPLPHAEAVCRELVRRGHKLYIVTNAVASVLRQQPCKLCLPPISADHAKGLVHPAFPLKPWYARRGRR